MCLYIESGTKAQIAKRDIPVFKRLLWLTNSAVSPYYMESYVQGQVKTLKCFSDDIEKHFFTKRLPMSAFVFGVGRGLHSYKTISYAKGYEYDKTERLVVRCYIPKGALYIEGEKNELVSLKLRVGKAVRFKGCNRKIADAFNRKHEKTKKATKKEGR
jgi:hypothetical protein